MDLLGISKRMFSQLGQMSPAPQAQKTQNEQATDQQASTHKGSGLNAHLQSIAEQFDLKSMAIHDLKTLQESLTDTGFIQSGQVRAQALLTQLAYHHQQAGPMDVEAALEDHLQRLKDQKAVLADYNEGKHLLNITRNLISARDQQTHAA